MALVQTEDTRLVRDTENRALLTTDAIELQRHRHQRSKHAQFINRQQQAADKFDAINNRLERCESLLQELSQHLSALVSRNLHVPTKQD